MLHCTDEAGEAAPMRPGGGKGASNHGTAGGKDGRDKEPE
jgi:hypothetical protein